MVLEPKNIPLKGLFQLPDELADAPTQARATFWRLIGIEARHLKEQEILSGIDRWGNKFLPVKRKWGDPTPLIPHGKSSRTYKLVTLNWTAQGATLYWRAGPGHVSWKTILGYHAYRHGPRSLPVRDEFGLSPKSIRILQNRAFEIWKTIEPRKLKREPKLKPNTKPKIEVKPKPKPKPNHAIEIKEDLELTKAEDRRRMEEADRLTREAQMEARTIMDDARLAAIRRREKEKEAKRKPRSSRSKWSRK